MRIARRHCLVLISTALLFFSQLPAQPVDSAPSDAARYELPELEFIHPLEGPVHVSGSFGEYRRFSRYHHGLDYKTFNRNGLTVRTPLAGVVERIHVSKRGYGNALFLASPGGVRTTYAHLNDFLCPGAAGTARSDLEQLRRAVEFLTYHRGVFVKIPPWFRFQSGECIARSGESGSGAPHLHFEVQRNGRYVDPLNLRGMRIPDTSAPTMLNLYVEDARGVQRLPLRVRQNTGDHSRRKAKPNSDQPQVDQEPVAPGAGADAAAAISAAGPDAPRKIHYEVDPEARLDWKPTGRVRYLIGAYDTQAARNRNGVGVLSLSVGGRKSFQRELDVILQRDLARSSSVYHTARTVIGREYVYLLYGGAGAGQRSPTFVHAAGAAIRVVLGDATGNQAILEMAGPADIPLMSESEVAASQSAEASGALQRIPVGGTTVLRRQSAHAGMEIRFVPRSLHEDGEARLWVGQSLSGAARKNVRIPPELAERPGVSAAVDPAMAQGEPDDVQDSGAGRAARSPTFQLEGSVFTLNGRDLFYRSGARAEAWFDNVSEDAEGSVALYTYHKTVGRWLLVAYPYREENGRSYYRFPFRYEDGSLAQLRDLSPPRILQPSLWAPPTQFDETRPEIVREFMVIDRGSGFSKADTEVLIDGRPAPFAWIPDRAALQLRLPLALVPERGLMISIRAADHSGNRSAWLFDFLEAPALRTE